MFPPKPKALTEARRGDLPDGSRVLVCLTGGTGDPDGRAEPDYWIRDAEDHSERLGRALLDGSAP